jgi:hypothetical protein
MKPVVGMMIALIPLGITAAAWANPSVRPAPGDALELGTHQVGVERSPNSQGDRIESITHQINQPNSTDAANETSQPANRQPAPRILPEGMVVQSSSFGGVSVGVEF